MKAGHLSRLGLLAAGAVGTYVFESLLPMPIPWARVGLSNVFVVLSLFWFGLGDAFLVNLVRVGAGGLLLGIIFSPAFVFSLGGSTVAVLIMGLARWRLVPPFSIIGTSCLGAVANNVVQVLLFTFVLSWPGVARDLVGVFVLLGVIVGFLTGLIASGVLRKVGLESTRGVG
jgi:heptaprenyl diphosphate synthase